MTAAAHLTITGDQITGGDGRVLRAPNYRRIQWGESIWPAAAWTLDGEQVQLAVAAGIKQPGSDTGSVPQDRELLSAVLRLHRDALAAAHGEIYAVASVAMTGHPDADHHIDDLARFQAALNSDLEYAVTLMAGGR